MLTTKCVGKPGRDQDHRALRLECCGNAFEVSWIGDFLMPFAPGPGHRVVTCELVHRLIASGSRGWPPVSNYPLLLGWPIAPVF
jgi:hypothetical protein